MSTPYDQFKQERNKVNVMWDSYSAKHQRCSFCQQKAFVVKEDGKKLLRCTKGCKDQEIINPNTQQKQSTSKFGSKYGSNQQSHSYILSQPRRRKHNSIEDEDREMLKGLYGSTDEITLVDSNEARYES